MIEQEACAQKGSYLKRLVENLLSMIEQEACASNHDLCQLLKYNSAMSDPVHHFFTPFFLD